jgi:O-antigen ligase
MSAYASAQVTSLAPAPRKIGVDIKRLARAYVWVTIASSGIVFSEPALCDALMVGAIVVLPAAGLTRFTRGIALYFSLWMLIVAAGFVAATQAGIFDAPAKHMGITLYLALSSVVLAAFVLDRPTANIRLIMSAYLVAALVAACAGLIGYFDLVPGTGELFGDERVRGTFKDPNVLGAFLVPALLYVLNLVMRARGVQAGFSLLAAPILLFASLLAFSRGAWINLAVSLLAYAYFVFASAASHRQRLKLIVYVVVGLLLAAGTLVAALNVPKVSELMGERAHFAQSYDVDSEGRFPGQQKAVGLILAHPLGVGALEFARAYYVNDAHQVYLSMYLNAGWVGGTLYLAVVLLTLFLALRQVVGDRGGDGISAVLAAAFIGMALEAVVIDTDHWRHFYLIMAMIWGMALAPGTPAAWPQGQTRGSRPA